MQIFEDTGSAPYLRPMRFVVLLLVLSACAADETISGYADKTAVYTSQDYPGAALQFPEKGRVTGTGPCNRFSGQQSAPYPWIQIGPLVTTKTACPLLDDEARFFAALETATLVEVHRDTLLITTENGTELTFRALPREEVQ